MWALVAASRALTLAPDPWEWDEILFTRAVRDGIDLRAGRPQAPGYPLFIECGRAVSAVGLEPFRAVTVVGAAGGALAPAALSALLLSLGLPVSSSVVGGALYAFVPSVWLHAGRPLSDSPAAALFLASSAAFVAAARRRDGGLLAAAAVLAGLCFGVRPQTAIALLPCGAYVTFAFLRRGRALTAIPAAVAGVVTAALCYVPAVRGSGGWTPFRDFIARQAAHVRAEDTLRLSDFARVATWSRWVRDPFGPDALAAVFLVLAVAGCAAAPRQALVLAALFLPLAAVTVPFSSLPAAPRYAVVLLPWPCGLAALAFRALAGRARRAAAFAGTALVGASAAVAAPAVIEVATRPSPPVAAFRALGEDPAFVGKPLVAWTGLYEHRLALLPGRPARDVREDEIADVSSRELIVMADDTVFGQTPTRRFAFSTPLLLRISRARFLNVSIVAGDPGVGLLRPWPGVRSDYDWATGDALLRPGDVFTVRGPTGPVAVHVEAEATPREATLITIHLDGASRGIALASGEKRAVEFRASPGAGGVLFRIAAEDGPVVLSGWHVRGGDAP